MATPIYVKGDGSNLQIGALYSTKTKKFLETKTLFRRINQENVELTTNPRLSMDTTRNTSQSTAESGYQGNLTAHAKLAGTLEIDVTGSIDGKNNDTNKHGSFKLQVEAQTCQESIKHLEKLKNCYYNLNELKDVDLYTTYVVVAINWGARFEISCEEKKQRSSESDNLDVDARTRLNLFIAKIDAKGGFRSRSQSSIMTDDFEYHLKSYGLDLDLPKCKSLDDLMDRAFELPNQIKEKGTGLQYTLLPLIAIYKILDDKFVMLSEEQVEVLEKHVEDVNAKKAKWKEVMQFFNQEFIPIRDMEIVKGKYDEFTVKWHTFEKQFLDKLNSLHLRKVFYKNADLKELIEKLDEIISENRTNLNSPSDEVNKLHDMHKFNKKFIDDQLNVEYVGKEMSHWTFMINKTEETCIYYSTLPKRTKVGKHGEPKNFVDFKNRAQIYGGVKHYFVDLEFHEEFDEKFDTIERFSSDSFRRVLDNERLYNENKKLEGKNEALENQVTSLKKKITGKEKEVKDLKGRNEDLENQVASLNEEITGNRREVKNLKGGNKDLENKIASLKKKITGKEKEITNLEKTKEKFSKKITGLDKDVSDNRKEIKDLKESNGSLREENTILNNSIVQLEEKISDREQESENLKECYGRLEENIFDREQKIENLKENEVELSMEITSLKEKISGLNKDVSVKGEEIQDLKGTNGNLNEVNTLLNNAMTELTKNDFDRRTEIIDLKNPRLKIENDSGTSAFYKKAVSEYYKLDFGDHIPFIEFPLSNKKYQRKIHSLCWILLEQFNIKVEELVDIDVMWYRRLKRRFYYIHKDVYQLIFILLEYFDEISEALKDASNEVNCNDLRKYIMYFLLKCVPPITYSTLMNLTIRMHKFGIGGRKWHFITEAATAILYSELDEETEEINFKDENLHLDVFTIESQKDIFHQMVKGCFEELVQYLQDIIKTRQQIHADHGEKMRQIADECDRSLGSLFPYMMLASHPYILEIKRLFQSLEDATEQMRNSHRIEVNKANETLDKLQTMVANIIQGNEIFWSISVHMQGIKDIVERFLKVFALLPTDTLQLTSSRMFDLPEKAKKIRQWLDKDVPNVKACTDVIDKMSKLLLEFIDTLLLQYDGHDIVEKIENIVENFELLKETAKGIMGTE